MYLSLFVTGALVGLSVAAPVGPICILGIRQSTAYGFIGGFVTGLAAALADGVYTISASFGALVFNAWIHEHAFWFYLIGGIFLLYLAHVINKTKLEVLDAKRGNRSLMSAFFYTMFMTFMSPFTTMLFISMLTSYGIFELSLTTGDIFILGAGTFIGALSWWTLVSLVVPRAYKRKPEVSFAVVARPENSFRKAALRFLWPELTGEGRINVFIIVNRVAALIIAGYGIYTLSKVL